MHISDHLTENRQKTTLPKFTFPNGIFTCPGPSGNGICLALVFPSFGNIGNYSNKLKYLVYNSEKRTTSKTMSEQFLSSGYPNIKMLDPEETPFCTRFNVLKPNYFFPFHLQVADSQYLIQYICNKMSTSQSSQLSVLKKYLLEDMWYFSS